MENIKIVNDSALAIDIFRKASQRMSKRGEVEYIWKEEILNFNDILLGYPISKNDFFVIYFDDKPVAAAILQEDEDYLLGQRYAGNPTYSNIFKTKDIFNILKTHSLNLGKNIKIGFNKKNKAKLRLYESQGFLISEINEDYILLEYNPRTSSFLQK